MIASLKANSVDFDAGDGVALTRQYSGGIEYVEGKLSRPFVVISYTLQNNCVNKAI
jgi:hypothetical protein